MSPVGFHGKVAIVTGAANGIGRVIAQGLRRRGAHLILIDRDRASLEKLGGENPESTDCYALDVTNYAEVATTIETIAANHGRIDILINNAGIQGPVAPIWDIDVETFRAVIDVNLTGCFNCMRATIPVMRRQEPSPHRGHIVNMASVQGKEGMALGSAYSASKAAVIGLTKSVGKELAREEILVNCIAPTAIDIGMAHEISESRRAEILARIPMGRFGRTDEVEAMVAWLASGECSFSTGAVFDLSGGRATY